MKESRCPGTDLRNWKPEDIGEVACPQCGAALEIWKDEPMRFCPACQSPVRNPRTAPNCETWCSLAARCPGVMDRKKHAPQD